MWSSKRISLSDSVYSLTNKKRKKEDGSSHVTDMNTSKMSILKIDFGQLSKGGGKSELKDSETLETNLSRQKMRLKVSKVVPRHCCEDEGATLVL